MQGGAGDDKLINATPLNSTCPSKHVVSWHALLTAVLYYRGIRVSLQKSSYRTIPSFSFSLTPFAAPTPTLFPSPTPTLSDSNWRGLPCLRPLLARCGHPPAHVRHGSRAGDPRYPGLLLRGRGTAHEPHQGDSRVCGPAGRVGR